LLNLRWRWLEVGSADHQYYAELDMYQNKGWENLQALVDDITAKRINSDVCAIREREIESSLKIDFSCEGEDQVDEQNQAKADILTAGNSDGWLRFKDRERIRDSVSSEDLELEMPSDILKVDPNIKMKSIGNDIERVFEKWDDISKDALILSDSSSWYNGGSPSSAV
jgi:hypothetical protein